MSPMKWSERRKSCAYDIQADGLLYYMEDRA